MNQLNNPYDILGIPPTATDDEVREAYRKLSMQYHPDLHQKSPLSDVAEEKMKTLNAAYDQIMDMRRGGEPSVIYNNPQSQYNGRSEAGAASETGSGNVFTDARRFIQQGNVTTADSLLDQTDVPRNAEWNFLKGSICYARGWLNDAFQYFSNAVNMDPGNQEYRATFIQMQNNRRGNMNGSPYRPYNTNQNNGMMCCSPCDTCQGLICADCCCECMGGDLIPCC